MNPLSASPVTVHVEPLGVALDTWRAPLLLRGERVAAALLGDWADGSMAVLAGDPVELATVGDAAFATLDRMPVVIEEAVAPDPGGTVGGGWFGVLGYPLGSTLEAVGGPPPRPVPRAPSALSFHDHVLRQDAGGTWWFEALVTPQRERFLQARCIELRARAEELQDGPIAELTVSTGAWLATPSAAAHAAAVDACVRRIHHGDLFQANICQRLSATLDGELLDLFARAYRALRPAKAGFVSGHWGAVASLSPELYLRRRGRAVRSSPIKGTRPRGANPQADAEAEAELLAAEKDRAEHVMIVDLVRNDLGRVCVPGSIHVTAFARAREAPGVWHLVSDVEGVLPEGVGDCELVRATFPPGSVTGAPKVAAMRVINELESTGREAYTGAIGLASPLAGLDLNVAIRTLESDGEKVWLGVGGGIVADSVGTEEAREAADKAAPLLAAIGAPPFAVARAAGPQVMIPNRSGPTPVPRPDPRSGVFETLLVLDGEPQQLDAHLARLTASTVALYDDAVPLRPLIARISAAAAAADVPARARLRVDVRPTPTGALEVEVACGTVPVGAAGPVVLRVVVVPGGLGAHKWADRRIWDALAAEDPGALPLAVDLDGFVLETARANVFAVIDGVDVTPPLDGRILPGITRELRLADLRERSVPVCERPLALDELRAATAIVITGALRGEEVAVLAPSPSRV